MRRVVDIVVAIGGGIVLLPVILVLAVVVALSMGSPVLFTQWRSGKRGVLFKLVKFRSMTDARDSQGRLLPDEMRLTAVGRFLRRSRLDELPELWNIARGDMSLIGPRPLLPQTVRSFGRLGRRRGLVRPGLTGWAQINGNTLLADREKLMLDLWYVDNRSLAVDLGIVVKTIKVAVFGERVNPVALRRALSAGSYEDG
jgi:lipopolysaccharide/colanic/teichoic acid biosynthesis glycosyltransferase